MAEAKTQPGAGIDRPLSPHLQVHGLPVNMVMSILHRITGAALYFGTLLLAWWLLAAATGPSYFDFVNGLFATWPGKLILIGYTWALLNHLLGGVRHFIWDTGHGFAPETIDKLCWGTALLALLLTLIVVWIAFGRLGGA